MKPERTHELKVPAAMEMLRPGEVKPRGWLRDWCITAHNGYVSRLGQIDPNIDRAWCSGYELHGKFLNWGDPEKGALPFDNAAYWFEGLTRLAWQLEDEELMSLAKRKFERLLSSMNPRAIGFVHWLDRTKPEDVKEVEDANHGFIIGSCGRLARGLISYYETTGDERALRALDSALDDPRIFFLAGQPCGRRPLIWLADGWRVFAGSALRHVGFPFGVERPDGSPRPRAQTLRHCPDDALRRLRPRQARALRRHRGTALVAFAFAPPARKRHNRS